MPMVLEPTSSPRKRPPKGAGALSVADRLGDGPVAGRELREFLTFESTSALYAPDHPPPSYSSRRNQRKTFSDYPQPTKNKIFTPPSSRS